MNQFKPLFLGQAPPGLALEGLKRAANSQKCIRAGGKHNDLDDVGKDTYHHTFFEMLGNWSFGDYFKAEAIEWAWDLLTKVWGLAPDRLYATYFGAMRPGPRARHRGPRPLAASTCPPSACHPGKKDNFWEMGDTGPCGPCSEIHIDRHPRSRCRGRWSTPATPRHRDLEPGLHPVRPPERGRSSRCRPGTSTPAWAWSAWRRVLQGKTSNYDTDLFTPIFAAIEQLTGARAYHGKLGKDDPEGRSTRPTASSPTTSAR
jgi:alanyl-tRNA synthetase